MLSLDKWLQKLGIEKINKNLINTALIHRSYKGMGYKGDDNERLEFVGDAVLDLINAYLFYKEKTLTEADMTEKRKRVVSNDQLAKLFNKIGMVNYIKTAKNLKLSNKIKADFVEALFGAVFMAYSNGYEKSLNLWKKIQTISANEKKVQKKPTKGWKNAKSTLVEFCQQYSFVQPAYTTINKQGPDHNPLYTVRVTIEVGGNNSKFRDLMKLKSNQKLRVFSDGIGKNKRTAEMKAAQNLCKKIGLRYSN